MLSGRLFGCRRVEGLRQCRSRRGGELSSWGAVASALDVVRSSTIFGKINVVVLFPCCFFWSISVWFLFIPPFFIGLLELVWSSDRELKS